MIRKAILVALGVLGVLAAVPTGAAAQTHCASPCPPASIVTVQAPPGAAADTRGVLRRSEQASNASLLAAAAGGGVLLGTLGLIIQRRRAWLTGQLDGVAVSVDVPDTLSETVSHAVAEDQPAPSRAPSWQGVR